MKIRNSLQKLRLDWDLWNTHHCILEGNISKIGKEHGTSPLGPLVAGGEHEVSRQSLNQVAVLQCIEPDDSRPVRLPGLGNESVILALRREHR